MIALERAFDQARRENRKALICYLAYGFPDVKTHLELARTISRYCDVLEVGLPYSDPVADGPVIQEAHRTALAQKVNYDHLLSDYSRLNLDCAAVLMGYAGAIYKYGISRFSHAARECGFSGMVVPDLPYEEQQIFKKQALLPVISFVSPTTPDERVKKIAEEAEGFIYIISSLGVTGMRRNFDTRLRELTEKAKQHSRVPVCAGFGISTPEQASRVAEFADGVIVGSAIIKQIRENRNSLGNFVGGLKQALYEQR